MGFFSFGSRIKNRKFDYIPRYYDPDKEELQERIKRYNREPGDAEISKQRIRGGFKRNYRSGGSEYAKKTKQKSNRILLMTIGVLLVITYIFIAEYLPRIVANFE